MNNRHIIETYINGWKNSDSEKICSVLADNCIIIESHGPKYSGINAIKRWIESWIKSKNKVAEWVIISYEEKQEKVFVEWKFECIVDEKQHSFEGMSIFKIKNSKIGYIREYKTTKPVFEFY